MPGHRGGTVTFVFTDIEGSTRLVQEFKERWPEVRSVHRLIVREAFEAHGGDEVDTQGDSFFYVFGRARDAALAAADAQRGLAGHDWPEAGRVRIRIGMHPTKLIDAAGSGWGADYPTPSNFFGGVLACAQLKLVCDRALDHRVQQLSALATHDSQRAGKEWATLDQQVSNRALVIPIASTREIDFSSKRLGNFEYHPVYGLLLDQTWVR